MDRDTKLIAILRRQYHIILTALRENIFCIGQRRFATPPNTEYIFAQLAVNIMWYCRLKIAISLYNNFKSNNSGNNKRLRYARYVIFAQDTVIFRRVVSSLARRYTSNFLRPKVVITGYILATEKPKFTVI